MAARDLWNITIAGARKKERGTGFTVFTFSSRSPNMTLQFLWR
jgi:hypothetical protein